MATNLAGSGGTLYSRPFFIQGTDLGSAPPWFRHKSAASPIAAIVFPDTLNQFEQAEVQRYLSTPTDATLATLRLPGAIAKAKEYKTYFADASVKAWQDADRTARDAQWRLYSSDSVINNAGTTSPSADAGGAGAAPPPANQPPGTYVP